MLTRNDTVSALIHSARIVDVNVANYTVVVATQFTKKLYSDVSFNIPYAHPNNGEGIYFMPEVGSLCWLCEPSDGSMPFILGWTTTQDENDFSARRQGLNPGDIYLGTRDNNFLWLHRGGVVQIGSTGICQRIFIPVDNSINDFCENYNLHSLGGDLTWNVQRSVNDTGGKRPALFTLAARQFADDQNPIATMEIGSHGSNDNTILSLRILGSGAQGAAEQISLKMDDQGNVSWVVQADVTYEIHGRHSITVDDDFVVESKNGNVSLTSDSGNATLAAGPNNVEASPDGVAITAPVTTVSQILEVAGGGKPVALAPVLILWLATHVHPTTAPGAPTGPAIVPPPSAIASTMLSSGS